MNWPKEVVIIGAGNVAWHLGRRLQECGVPVAHVHARHVDTAKQLAAELDCSGSNDLSDIPARADLYLVAVSDAAIPTVTKALVDYIDEDSLVMHTSGATPSTVFQPYFRRYGVFYPLQTFSKKRIVDFSQVPLCICTYLPSDFEPVSQLAHQLSDLVYTVSDEQRLSLHLAAVFVNNFTNYLQYISESLLAEQALSTKLLHPLLAETVAKLQDLSAKEAQTGPAIRGDAPTINRHLSQLADHPEWQVFYRLLSEGIQKDLSA